MKIKFTADTNPKLQGGDFKKGATLECSSASAHHWIRRGVAVEVVDKPAPTLKVGRPMMADPGVHTGERVPVAASVDIPRKPKKVGRPKKGA